MNLGIQIGGSSFEETVKEVEAIDPEVARCLVEDAYGKVLSRGGLPLIERELCIIAALAASGYDTQLSWHVNAARNLGTPIEALREVLVQLVPLSGWPTALNALRTAKKALAGRGEVFPGGPRGEQLDRDTLRSRGRRHGGEVYADYGAVERSLAELDPDLPDYVTEGAYGTIYGRPGLSMRQRELVAVAILTAQQRLQQLRSHIEGAHRVGATPSETKEVIVTMILYAGWPAALNALGVWKRVLGEEGDRREQR